MKVVSPSILGSSLSGAESASDSILYTSDRHFSNAYVNDGVPVRALI